MCAPYLEKLKPSFLPWFIKRSSVHVTENKMSRFFMVNCVYCDNRRMHKSLIELISAVTFTFHIIVIVTHYFLIVADAGCKL